VRRQTREVTLQYCNVAMLPSTIDDIVSAIFILKQTGQLAVHHYETYLLKASSEVSVNGPSGLSATVTPIVVTLPTHFASSTKEQEVFIIFFSIIVGARYSHKLFAHFLTFIVSSILLCFSNAIQAPGRRECIKENLFTIRVRTAADPFVCQNIAAPCDPHTSQEKNDY